MPATNFSHGAIFAGESRETSCWFMFAWTNDWDGSTVAPIFVRANHSCRARSIRIAGPPRRGSRRQLGAGALAVPTLLKVLHICNAQLSGASRREIQRIRSHVDLIDLIVGRWPETPAVRSKHGPINRVRSRPAFGWGSDYVGGIVGCGRPRPGAASARERASR